MARESAAGRRPRVKAEVPSAASWLATVIGVSVAAGRTQAESTKVLAVSVAGTSGVR
ncbi:hypothetical protein SGRIM128S_04668 [Streptomyces griseomycini]